MRRLLLMTGFGKMAFYLVLCLAGRPYVFAGDNATTYFIPIAHRMAVEGKFNDVSSRDDSSVPPGYPFVLAALERLGFRSRFWLLVCLQLLADTIVALLLLRMGNNMGNKPAGFLAGMAWLLYPPAWIIATWISPETLFTAFFVAGLFHVFAGGAAHAAWGGLFLGTATLFRADSLLLPAVFITYWLWRRKYRSAAVFAVVFGIVLGPWTLRNLLVLDDPIVVTSSFGAAFLQGSDERFYQGKMQEYPALFAEAESSGLTRPAVQKGTVMSRWMARIALQRYATRIRTEGWRSVSWSFARKFAQMWFLTESGNPRAQWFLFWCAAAAAPLGLIELATWFKPADPARFLCAATVLYWILIHSLIVPLARYLLPVFPLILLAACFRAQRIWHIQPLPT